MGELTRCDRIISKNGRRNTTVSRFFSGTACIATQPEQRRYNKFTRKRINKFNEVRS